MFSKCRGRDPGVPAGDALGTDTCTQMLHDASKGYGGYPFALHVCFVFLSVQIHIDQAIPVYGWIL
jgi:hypothetical protein